MLANSIQAWFGQPARMELKHVYTELGNYVPFQAQLALKQPFVLVHVGDSGFQKAGPSDLALLIGLNSKI